MNHLRMQIKLHEARATARKLFLAALVSGTVTTTAWAQPPAQQGGKGTSGAKTQTDTTRKLSDKELRQERARELFADAANAQNNGAYGLAIDQWKKLLKDYPNDALASSARHFLGVCYQEQETPDFESAIQNYRMALEDANLKQREESLINLGWCLYQRGMTQEGDEQKSNLKEAVKVFGAFLDKYSDSSLADKAMFYSGESEAKLGNTERAIHHYNQLVQARAFSDSPIRPDALFALAFSYEEQKQPKLAKENYDAFLAKYVDHQLNSDVRTRLAELAINSEDYGRAIELLTTVTGKSGFEKSPIADYVLYRYAFALAKAGKFQESSAIYKKLSEQFPKSQYAQNASLATGQTLMRDNKYKEAWDAFSKLLGSKDERAAEAAHWMCQIAILQNRAKDAIPIARDALTWGAKSPMGPMLKMDLADGLYATTEGKAEANKIYEQVAVEHAELPIAPRATYNAAFSALQAGNHAEAQRWSEAFSKRFSNDPLSADVAYVRAESLLQLGQFESAITALDQLITSSPNDAARVNWELRLSTAQYLGNQLDKAIASADQLLKNQKDQAVRGEAFFLRGASLLKQQKVAEAQESLKSSIDANPTWTQGDEVLLLWSQALSSLKKSDEAKSVLERLIKDFPNSRFRSQAEFKLGQILAYAGKFDQALQYYDRVLSGTTDKSLLDFVNYDKAYVLIQQSKLNDAIPLLDSVLASTKNENLIRESKTAKAVCLRRVGQPKEAIQLLEGLNGEQLPQEQLSKILYELGVTYGAVKEHDKAIVSLEKLIQTDPKYSLIDRATFELAWSYKSKGDMTRANQLFQQVAEQFPESPLAAESYFHVGQAEYENSKFDRAVKAYTVAATKTANAELQEKSLYKLGLAFFQQREYDKASAEFNKQIKAFPDGELSIDARFMSAECSLKGEKYSNAWPLYEQARKALENSKIADSVNAQVKALIYLHGAQSARELKKWSEVETWINRMNEVVPDSPYAYVGKFELASAKQNQKKAAEALALFGEVAESQRNELGARSRFMMGEVYFADHEFAKAVSEFQKVMYGFGGNQAPSDIKNWQARAAFEAGRCSEVLIADLTGERKKKAIDVAKKFYDFLVSNHADHSLAGQAKERINVLGK